MFKIEKHFRFSAFLYDGLWKASLLLAALSPCAAFANTNGSFAESLQQQKNLTTVRKSPVIGVITDSDTGNPLIGASVKVKGSKVGVITDMDGKFEISVSPKDVLTFSYIGYTPKEIKVGSQKVLSVTLSDNAQKLNELVITAYGAGQKKESVVGSIQQIKPDDLLSPSANLSNSFAGRLAGVVAFQRSGLPGENGSNFYIRGISTLSGTTSPLIILDGVEVSSSDLNSLDPDVIESFSILKDATATAMYGTRGANGVMIVTTKSGMDLEKPVISVRVEANVTTPTKIPKFVDGPQFMRLYNEAVTNQGTGDVLYSEEDINNTAAGLNPYIWPNVDWYKEVFKDVAFNQKANFNIRGGTSKITYFMNVNVSHETGMLKNRAKDYYSYNNNLNIMRYAFQNNIDFNMSRSSKISLHLNVQLADNAAPVADKVSNTSISSVVSSIYNQVINNNPVAYPVNFPKGTEDWVRWGGTPAGTYSGVNPIANLTSGYANSFASTVVANLNYQQKLDVITKGLSFNAMISFKNWSKTYTNRRQGANAYYLSDWTQEPDGSYTPVVLPTGGNPTKPVMSSYGATSGDRRWYFQAYFGYVRSFGRHNVNAMALINLDNLDSNTPGSDLISSLPRRKIGYAFRASYDYAHRYMLEFNAGYNGSENFADGHRWGFFPSIAAGWNISQETFWKPLAQVISNFKLRTSYGLVGNDQIGGSRFIYMPLVDLDGNSGYQIGIPGATQNWGSGIKYTRYENKNITWEIGRKFNVGFDLQLFHSLNIAFDVFKEIRSDIFQSRGSIPNYLGTSGITIYGNLAKVKNYGVDMSVDYGKRITKDFSMQFKGTFTFSRNRVLEYDEPAGTRPANSRIGHSINTIFGYVTDGLFRDKEDIENSPTSKLGNIAIAPGDVKYVDQPDVNGVYDGQITSEDKVALGYPTVPEIVYGFGPSMSYKNWDFSFFFQGVANTSLMMSGFAPFGAQVNRNVLTWIADDYYSEENPNVHAKHPRLTKYANENNMQSSDYWLRNGAFLKLKNLEFGYTFKNGPRVYVNGTNLLTFSPFKLWDPEMGGGRGLSYPTMRTFNIGVQLIFNK